MKLFSSLDDIRPCACWPDLDQVLELPAFTRKLYYACPSCAGKTKVDCQLCQGSGFDGACHKCSGKGSLPCDYCQGRGRLKTIYPHFGDCTKYQEVKA